MIAHRFHLHWGRKGTRRKLLRVIALALFAAGFFMLSRGGMAHSTPASQANSSRLLSLIGEQEWGMWHAWQLNVSFPTTQAAFRAGQTITVPNYVSIRVDGVDRNWQPQPWQQSPAPVGGQDDASGKEVILVHFTLTNLSTEPIGYSDQFFSLVRANGHEQRVAALAELGGDQYGSFGHTSPWLFPGASAHTFVPFLVNPGEQPRFFVFYWSQLKPNTQTSGKNPRGIKPLSSGVARITFALTGLQVPQVTAAASVSFVPNTTFTVRSTDVYSH